MGSLEGPLRKETPGAEGRIEGARSLLGKRNEKGVAPSNRKRGREETAFDCVGALNENLRSSEKFRTAKERLERQLATVEALVKSHFFSLELSGTRPGDCARAARGGGPAKSKGILTNRLVPKRISMQRF